MNEPSRLRILFVLEYFWPQVGGIENLFDNLTRALTDEGHHCTVLTAQLPGTQRFEQRAGVDIHRIGSPFGANRYAFTLLALPAALRLARRADLVHTTTYNASLPAWLAATLCRRPAVITAHEFLGALWHALPDTHPLMATLFRSLERLSVGLPFHEYVAVSRATRNALRQFGVKDKKLSVVYNSHDTSGWKSDPATVRALREALGLGDHSLVGYYGRPGVTKGVEVLVSAFDELREGRPEARLLLILGAYPEARRKRLVAQARRTLGDSVVILDSVAREVLPSYLALCDVIAVPSLTEGFGFTTVEACALGRVVVASDVGSIPEVVSGRYLLSPPNDPLGLSRALCWALEGNVAETPPRDFPVGAMVAGYEAVYNKMRAEPDLVGSTSHQPNRYTSTSPKP